MPPGLLTPGVADGAIVGDLPQSGLLSAARPMGLGAVADGVPTGFVLPMIVAPADRKVLLAPDDLRANIKFARPQAFGDLCAEEARMPDVTNVAFEVRPGRSPVDSIVIQDFAE